MRMRCKACGREFAMLVRPGVKEYRCTTCSGALSTVTAVRKSPTPVERAVNAARAYAAGDLIRQYRLDTYLGRGAFGEVWRAEDLSLRRPVALKVLTHMQKHEVERFYHEARSVAALDHENIAPVYEVFESDANHFIVMKYLEGKTLDEAGLAVQALLEAMYLVCRAIDYAHRRGIVHRDLKPKNIMIEHPPERPDYRVFVCDFGLARWRGELEADRGHVVGTPAYMSPEQARGEIATPLSDVYGIGATLFTVLTGSPPFDGNGVEDVLGQVRLEEAPKLRALRSDLHPALENLVSSALAKQPSNRPPSARDMGEELRSLLDTGRVFHAAPAAVPDEVRDIAAQLRRGFGKYIVVKTLGENSTGPIFKAWDTSLQRFVAVRVLLGPDDGVPRESVEAALRDARSCAALRHPGIPQIFEIGEFRGRSYVSRAFVEGTNLSRMEADPMTVARILHDAAEAVQYAHGERIVHGNLTPDSILVGTDGRVAVIDFGFAFSHVDPSRAWSYRGSGETASPATDVFGLGATLYEVLCGGQLPRAEIRRLASANGPLPELPPTAPPELVLVALRALGRDGSKAFGSAFDVQIALQQVQDKQTRAMPRPETGGSPKTEDPRSTMEDRGAKAEDPGPKNQDREPKAEKRRPKSKRGGRDAARGR